MTELDYGQALVFLEKAVAEKGPDYVYERRSSEACVYFDQGKPSCIVGHMFDYMGLRGIPEGKAASQALETLGIAADTRTRDLLNHVQELQDTGVPWGDALRQAQGFDGG